LTRCLQANTPPAMENSQSCHERPGPKQSTEAGPSSITRLKHQHALNQTKLHTHHTMHAAAAQARNLQARATSGTVKQLHLGIMHCHLVWRVTFSSESIHLKQSPTPMAHPVPCSQGVPTRHASERNCEQN
jgi:hypothetical protein